MMYLRLLPARQCSKTDLVILLVSGSISSFWWYFSPTCYLFRDLLRKFIDDIRITPGNAAVHYKIPLPQGSPLAGEYEQDIPLPVDTLANRQPILG